MWAAVAVIGSFALAVTLGRWIKTNGGVEGEDGTSE